MHVIAIIARNRRGLDPPASRRRWARRPI